jgi:hypothetical protein
MRPELVLPLFLAVWAALLSLVGVFYWKGSLAAKRRFHPYVVVGAALIFLGFVTALLPASTFVVIVPGVALMSFLNYKMTKFCSSCGATVVQRPPWRELPSCPKCGGRVSPPA